MENMENRIKQNIDGLIFAFRSKGVEELSMTKLLLLINDKYRIELDQESLEELILNNDSVKEIIEDKIILGSKLDTDEEETSDTVKDMAADQARDDLNLLGDSYDAFSKLKGKELTLPYKLDESMKDYYLLKGVRKTKTPLIIESIEINKKQEMFLKCKLKNKEIFVEIPISSLR